MFNKEKFSEIIKKINDSYPTQYEFAEKSEVNRTYLSKYINMKLNNPPTSKILEKIAKASNGITTYNELMQVCGYMTVERTPIEDGAIEGLERMIENQVPGYSLIDITLKYIRRLEGKGR